MPAASLTVRQRAAGFALRVLRGAAQVVFLDNPWTGLGNFAAIIWAAIFGGGSAAMAVAAVLATSIATATAPLLGASAANAARGLYGFNGLLAGVAVAYFLPAGPALWLLVAVAAILSTVVAVALERWLAPYNLAGLTFPFVASSWLVLLAAYRLPGLGTVAFPPAALVAPVAFGSAADALALGRGILTSVSQIFLIDNPTSGAIFLAGFAIQSRICAAYVLYGAALATLLAALLGADAQMVAHGLWGYSAALTAPAIGCIFLQPGGRAFLLATAAIVLTLLLQAATMALLAPVALPALTFPFVLATWVFLLAARRA